MRYMLVQDVHVGWWLIPAQHQVAWAKWCDNCRDSDFGYTWQAHPPVWARKVGDPSRVTFESPDSSETSSGEKIGPEPQARGR